MMHGLAEFRVSLSKYRIRYGFGGLLCLALGAFIVAPALEFLQTPAEVRIFVPNHVDGLVQGGGGLIPLEVSASPPRGCEIDHVERVAWRWRPGVTPREREIMHLPTIQGAGNPFGEASFRLLIPMVARLDPGQWNIDGFPKLNCTWQIWWRNAGIGKHSSAPLTVSDPITPPSNATAPSP